MGLLEREDLFVPLMIQRKMVTFKDTENPPQKEAYVGDILIATIQLPAPQEALYDWAENVFKILASYSSTVMLRTRCDCKKLFTIDNVKVREVNVPMRLKQSSLVLAPTYDVNALSASYRVFKISKELDDVTGCRLFEEV